MTNPAETGLPMSRNATKAVQDKTVIAFIKPLRYVGSANYNMSRVYHTNPTMLQIASPKHCEFVPPSGGSTSKKPRQSCCTNRVTPRTTRQPITEDYKVIVSLLTRASLVATDGYIIG